jgi:AcrR family transcriptional regulator
MTTAREDLLAAGLAVFDRDGFEGATVAAIRTRARASNGSFFHFFGSAVKCTDYPQICH